MSAHVAPMYCPYCGGEQLMPHGNTHGDWECRECLRVFSAKFVGLLPRANPPFDDAATSGDPASEGARLPKGHVR